MSLRNANISFSVTQRMKAALEIEAWESGLGLGAYIRGLLERRGKWARTTGKATYDIGPPLTNEKKP